MNWQPPSEDDFDQWLMPLDLLIDLEERGETVPVGRVVSYAHLLHLFHALGFPPQCPAPGSIRLLVDIPVTASISPAATPHRAKCAYKTNALAFVLTERPRHVSEPRPSQPLPFPTPIRRIRDR